MGKVRAYKFDSVIGVGGTSGQPRRHGIGGKITWIGLKAQKKPHAKLKGPLVTFTHFRLYDSKGKDFRLEAPILASRMYATNPPRFLLRFTKHEQREIRRILSMAKSAGQSKGVLHLPRLSNRERCGCGGPDCY
jgi:hypothetical protein